MCRCDLHVGVALRLASQWTYVIRPYLGIEASLVVGHFTFKIRTYLINLDALISKIMTYYRENKSSIWLCPLGIIEK